MLELLSNHDPLWLGAEELSSHKRMKEKKKKNSSTLPILQNCGFTHKLYMWQREKFTLGLLNLEDKNTLSCTGREDCVSLCN